MNNKNNNNLAIVGIQWGDEGKGKIVDCSSKDFDIVVRFQGGANAGHTVVVEGEKYVFHLLPSGILNPESTCVIGNGVVVDLERLLGEIREVEESVGTITDRLYLSDRASVVLPYHKERDKASERKDRKIGTTLLGIGPSYSDKIGRRGIHIYDLLDDRKLKEKVSLLCEYNNKLLTLVYEAEPLNTDEVVETLLSLAKKVRPYIKDTVTFLHSALKDNKKILFEGAQGTMLDIDFGTYPYVTSSNTTAGGITNGCGVPPSAIGKVLGIMKAYTTRVGEGPFPTELTDEKGERLRDRGGEYGATTGRPRRCGWLDLVVAKYACSISGVDSLALTKLDVLDGFDEIKICTGYRYNGKIITSFPADQEICSDCVPEYEIAPGWSSSTEGTTRFEDLPENAQKYIQTLEELIGVPCSAISTGQGRESIIFKQD